eukprot:15437815-Alexandrium_andersonii.AAC.1
MRKPAPSPRRAEPAAPRDRPARAIASGGGSSAQLSLRTKVASAGLQQRGQESRGHFQANRRIAIAEPRSQNRDRRIATAE